MRAAGRGRRASGARPGGCWTPCCPSTRRTSAATDFRRRAGRGRRGGAQRAGRGARPPRLPGAVPGPAERGGGGRTRRPGRTSASSLVRRRGAAVGAHRHPATPAAGPRRPHTVRGGASGARRAAGLPPGRHHRVDADCGALRQRFRSEPDRPTPREARMDETSAEATHDLLLDLAGRVDDDLLAWARELVAVGETQHAVELISAHAGRRPGRAAGPDPGRAGRGRPRRSASSWTSTRALAPRARRGRRHRAPVRPPAPAGRGARRGARPAGPAAGRLPGAAHPPADPGRLGARPAAAPGACWSRSRRAPATGTCSPTSSPTRWTGPVCAPRSR